MKTKQIVLITLLIYANCQGASKSISIPEHLMTATAAMPASLIAQVSADTKSATEASSKVKSGGSAGCAVVACANDKAMVQDRRYKCVDILEGHTSWVKSIIRLADSRLASCSSDTTIRIWNLNEKKVNDSKNDRRCVDVFKVNPGDSSIIELSDGTLASCSIDGSISMWDLSLLRVDDTQRRVDVLEVGLGDSSITQLSDGTLASCSIYGSIRIWDLVKNKGDDPENDQRRIDILIGHTDKVNCIIQLTNGRLASCSNDKAILIWSKNFQGKYECVDALVGHTDCVTSVIQLADGSLASGSNDLTIRIWDLNKNKGYDIKKDQRCVAVLKGHKGPVNSLIQLADGKLASCSTDKTILIWAKNDQEQYQCVDALVGHTDCVTSVIQLADGRLASCCSFDKTILIWDQCVIDRSSNNTQKTSVSESITTTAKRSLGLIDIWEYFFGLEGFYPKLNLMG